MDDLLTTKQVQDILKVDRITVYRMLNDGRLNGVKIGQQWRFSSSEVERIVGLRLAPEAPTVDPASPNLDTAFPTHCVQTIQDLFAEVSQISALVVDMQGNPLTRLSHPTQFCQMILSSPVGENIGRVSFQSFAERSRPIPGDDGKMLAGSRFFTCHAGLQYIGAPIFEKNTQIGLFLAGQFYWQRPDPREEAERIRRLATECSLPITELQAAAQEIPVIDPSQHARVEAWPDIAARAVQSILSERLCFVERLQQIADLTHLS